ncbi:unnamed protein product [Prorocentrum cordatum]|nr:unnamed protein product [Polarella glacialis]
MLAVSVATEDDHLTASSAEITPHAQAPSGRRPSFHQRLAECKYIVVEVPERDEFDKFDHQYDHQYDLCDSLYGVGGYHWHYQYDQYDLQYVVDDRHWDHGAQPDNEGHQLSYGCHTWAARAAA